MKRRTFLKASIGGLPVWIGTGYAVAGPNRASSNSMRRVGMSTVTFRTRFRATQDMGTPDMEHELTLLDIPEYFADRFGLRNVEFWSKHFESRTPSYLQELKKKIAASRSRLINIQVDEAYNLSDRDEDKRRKSVALVREWLDVAAELGSEALRANPGRDSIASSVVSLKELNAHALKKGVLLLAENHGGIEKNPDVHLHLIRTVGSPNFRTLPDFGNYPEEIRYRALGFIMRYAHLVSAKVMLFNDQWEHVSFDFDQCMRIAEATGFRGIYSAEQWSPRPSKGKKSRSNQKLDFEKIADWTIDRIRSHL